jgi:hypothetical protein
MRRKAELVTTATKCTTVFDSVYDRNEELLATLCDRNSVEHYNVNSARNT